MRTIFWMSTLLATGLLAMPAMAQTDLSASNIRSGAPKAPNNARRSEPPPDAVPGAKARPDTVAPADRAAADLPPTEALFDAINRGDIMTARDAISRGADLDGINLLGLTPLELSVDLGRNDISFLLLSLRGGGGSVGGSQRSGPPPTQAAAAAPNTAAERRKAAADARIQARAQAVAARQPATPQPQANRRRCLPAMAVPPCPPPASWASIRANRPTIAPAAVAEPHPRRPPGCVDTQTAGP